MKKKNIKGISRIPQTLRFSYKCSDVIDQNAEKDYFYVFNKGDSEGFIIVSADDRANTILGYTDNGSFEYEKMPDNMKYWLDCYKMEMKSLDENVDLCFTTPVSKVKSEMMNDPKYVTIPSLDTLKTSIIPLLKTKWDQGYPYNAKCPVINGSTSVTGCVATAMAQIMKYHQWPIKGIGSYSYSWQEQTLSADFSNTTYDWLNMLNYGASNQVEVDAVSTLMYHCGVSVNMQYSPGGSSAYSESVSTALINYFNYDFNLKYLKRYNFKTSDWIKIIKDELSHSRPLYYSGNRGGAINGGHAFVCDGYDENDLFHINWGWSGSGNGFFNVSALGGNLNSGYNYYQDIVIGIQKPTGKEKEIISSNIVKRESFIILPNDTIGRNDLFNMSVTWLINRDFDSNVFNGEIAIGLYNDEEQITILKSQQLTGLLNNYGYNPYWINNVKITDEVPNGSYKLSFFARRTNQTNWQLVANEGEWERHENWIEVKVSNSSIIFRIPEPKSVKLSIKSLSIPESLDKDKAAEIKLSVQNTGMEYDSRLHVNLESVKDSTINQINAVIPAHILSGETKEFISNNKITVYPGKYKLKIYYDPSNIFYEDRTYIPVDSGIIVDISKPKVKEGIAYYSNTKTVAGKLLNPPSVSSNVSIQVLQGNNDVSSTYNSSDSTFKITPNGADSIQIIIRYYKSDDKTVYNENEFILKKTIIYQLNLSANTVSLNSTINSSDTIAITSNTSWTASSNQTWLTVSPESGSNNGTLTLKTTSANTASAYRTGTITVAGTGVTTQTITVIQQGVGNYAISTSSNPIEGGTTLGSGTFSSGSLITVTATDYSGYTFKSWTESGTVVSTNASYTFTLFANRILVANFSPVDISSGLVAYYPFNGNANDESGNGNNGAVTGATLSADRQGNANSRAYNFLGSSKICYISVHNSATLTFNKEATFSVFVKQNNWKGQNGWGSFIEDGSVCLLAKSSDENGFGIAYQGSPKGVSTWFGTYESWVKDKTLSTVSNYTYKNKFAELSASVSGDFTNKWVHVVYCIDNEGIRIYINGELIKISTSLMDFSKTNTQDLHIGRYANGWFRLDGVLDDIRIYNRALSGNEITKLFNLTQTPTPINNISINEVLKLYPNPAQNDLFIKIPSEKSVIKIYSLQGSLLKTVPAYQSNEPIDVSTLQSGVYLVKISGPDGKVYTGKFVKE